MAAIRIVNIRCSWRVSRPESQAIADLRHQLARVLREHGVAVADVDAAVMILGELLANACEHGSVPVDVALRTQRDVLELRVDDSGVDVKRPVARNPDALRGRGFEIIERLGGRIAVHGRPHSSVRVILPFSRAG